MSAVHSAGQDVRSNRPGIASLAALFTAEMRPFDRQLISPCRQLWVRPAQRSHPPAQRSHAPLRGALQPHRAGPSRHEDTDNRAASTLSHTTAMLPVSTTTSGRRSVACACSTLASRRTATAPRAAASPPTGQRRRARARVAASWARPRDSASHIASRPAEIATSRSAKTGIREYQRGLTTARAGTPLAFSDSRPSEVGRGRPAASSA